MLAAAKARRDADAANRDGAAIAAAAAGPTQVSNPEQHSPRGEVPEAGMTNLFLSFAVHHASSSSCHKQRRSSSCYGSQHQQAQRMHRGQCRACWQQVRVCGGTKSDHSVSSSPGPPHHSWLQCFALPRPSLSLPCLKQTHTRYLPVPAVPSCAGTPPTPQVQEARTTSASCGRQTQQQQQQTPAQMREAPTQPNSNSNHRRRSPRAPHLSAPREQQQAWATATSPTSCCLP